MRILILTGGRIDDDFALSLLKRVRFDRIIAADGALEFIDRAGRGYGVAIKPDDIAGDFDTVPEGILENFTGRDDICIHRFKPEKDCTDTEIAVQLAIHYGCEDPETEIIIAGAIGTRMDHTLANIGMLEQIRRAGMKGVIADRFNLIRLIEGRETVSKSGSFGRYVSLIPLTEELEDVTLTGFKYLLDHHNVRMGESLCVSNELAADTGIIRIGRGRALLIQSRD